MAVNFTIKQRDRLPEFLVTLQDANGNAVDVTGATIVFTMRLQNTTGTPQVNRQPVTIVTANQGSVKYVWAGGDTAVPGFYDAEFEVTFADGREETFPNNKNLTVQIFAEVALV